MTRRIAIATAVLVSAIGCGGNGDQPQTASAAQQAQDGAKQMQQGAEQMQQGARQMAQGAQQTSDQMAQGLQQMAQGFQQMAQGSAKTVDYEALKALLPDVSGWTRSNERGEQLSMPVSYSRAEARYGKDDSEIKLEITDTALSQALLAPMSIFLSSGYSERSDDGFKRATKVGGSPGMEEWQVGSKHGEVTAVVGGRFIVQGTGDGVASVDPVRQIVEAVDFSKLSSLK